MPLITLQESENPIASILILCQDNLEVLRDCLASIARTVDAQAIQYETLVLFQQTSRQSVETFLCSVRGVRRLRSRLNLGFAAGNNFAARYARGKYLVFLNDDTITQEGWLANLVRMAESNERIGAVGSRLLFPNGTLQEAGAIIWSDGSAHPLGRGEPAGSLVYSYVRDVDYCSANGMLMPRSVFDAIGGFDEDYFPGYYEDADLCMSVRHKLGRRIVYEPHSRIVHLESATSSRDLDFRSFLFSRHQAQFCRKWEHELRSYPSPEPQSRYAVERAVLHSQGNPKRVLVVDDRVPRLGMGSGFGRTADLLANLSGGGYAVAFAPTDRRHLPIENSLGILGIDLISEPLLEHLRDGHNEYDAVVISRPHNFAAFYAAVRDAMPHAAVVYDVEALYHRRLLLQAQAQRDIASRNLLEAEADAMQALELDMARTADRLVAISDSEVEWLQSIEGHAPVEFMRPITAGTRMLPADLPGRSGAIFVAGWLAGEASPNVSALRWYVERVLPKVRSAVPHFVTYVSGANAPLSVQAMEGDGLVLLGFVDSLERLYRTARVAIAPILAGAGVKIKTIEAMQHGVPVVATTIGAEGLGISDGLEIDVSDDPAEYANRLTALLTDDALWLRRRKALVQTMAGWEDEQIHWCDVVGKALHEPRAAEPLTV